MEQEKGKVNHDLYAMAVEGRTLKATSKFQQAVSAVL